MIFEVKESLITARKTRQMGTSNRVKMYRPENGAARQR